MGHLRLQFFHAHSFDFTIARYCRVKALFHVRVLRMRYTSASSVFFQNWSFPMLYFHVSVTRHASPSSVCVCVQRRPRSDFSTETYRKRMRNPYNDVTLLVFSTYFPNIDTKYRKRTCIRTPKRIIDGHMENGKTHTHAADGRRTRITYTHDAHMETRL